MSIFKEHKTSADRSASDRRRHKKKIEDAIREGIYDIIAEESIIGKDGKKKIKIPVRGIKEYRFVFDDNDKNKKVGSAQGKEIRRGQIVGKKQQQHEGEDQQAGDKPGEEYYEVEITLEELASYLFDSLDLPDLEKKRFKNIIGQKIKRHGYREKGIRPRLDKKQTVIKRLKRKASITRENNNEETDDERFPFHENDLKYKHIKPVPRESSNAVVFFIMDVSGSMTKSKKYIARSFFFLLYQFLRHKYNNVEVVFISHTVDAKEVTEDEFFSRGEAGGTIMSSGIESAIDVISHRFHPSNWNIYAFHCSDGDNWPTDNDKAVELSIILRDMCQLYGYCEIKPEGEEYGWSSVEGNESIFTRYSYIEDIGFKIARLSEPFHIWPAFKKFFGGKYV